MCSSGGTPRARSGAGGTPGTGGPISRCLDQVLPHKAAIEKQIAECGQTLFGQSYRFLLYYLTSTYFEGQVPHNPKTKRGYSRDRRPDCSQVCIRAVMDREGFPVGYEVLAGNVRDHQTVAGMLDRSGPGSGSPTGPSAWIGGWSWPTACG